MALALAYFGIDPLPRELVEMPLEYFAGTVSWLKTQPMANGDKISVMSALKGGELALLLGAIYPENVKAVVGSVPRVVVRQEISFGGPSRHPRLPWTLGGKLK